MTKAQPRKRAGPTRIMAFSRSRPRLRSSLLALLPLTLLAGCGGGGGVGGDPVGGGNNPDPVGNPAKTSSVVARIVWPEPEPARGIPSNAQSLKIELRKNGATIATRLVARPANTATFDEIPLGPLVARATAYASLDGSGVALATADVPGNVEDGTPLNLNLNLASTIDRLEVAPTALVFGAGAALPFTVVAKDAAGSPVLLAPGALTVASSAPALVTVGAGTGGAFTATAAVAVGTATLTVTEADSGKTAVIPVTVKPTVSLDAASVTMSVGASRTFVATVRGPANTAVTWSVTEAGGGAVTSGGAYTAPAGRGTYHLVATSVADPTVSATATLTVRSGSGTVTVN